MRSNFLISIHPEHSARIFNGQKTAELRNRAVHIPNNSRLWIYETRPTMGIVGYATVETVVRSRPPEIWKNHGSKLAISKTLFIDYVQNRDIASAIILSDVTPLQAPIGLKRLKKKEPLFHPPQFYYGLGGKPGLWKILSGAI